MKRIIYVSKITVGSYNKLKALGFDVKFVSITKTPSVYAKHVYYRASK